MLAKVSAWLRTRGFTEKLIGRIRSPRSYSQYGEDVFLKSFYDRLQVLRGIVVNTGTIVDVGGYRPIRLSNTYLFYKAGWRSVNIDPAPEAKALFDRVRPQDVNLQIAIADREGEGTLYYFGAQSVYNSLSKDAANAARTVLGVDPKMMPVRMARLDAVMREYVDPKTLEMLLVDAEGLDQIILETNDWTIYRPRIVLVEVHSADVSRLADHPICVLMDGFGYKLFSAMTPNLMFVRQDSLPH